MGYSVHAFLEQWGLINYQVDADCRPTMMAPPSTGHFLLLADTPTGLQPVRPELGAAIKKEPLHAPAVENGEKDAAREGDGSWLHRIDYSQRVTSERADKADKKSAVSTWGTRTDRYAKQLAAMKASGAAVGREWSDQETLLLLEALQMYKDDWNKVLFFSFTYYTSNHSHAPALAADHGARGQSHAGRVHLALPPAAYRGPVPRGERRRSPWYGVALLLIIWQLSLPLVACRPACLPADSVQRVW